ncbi:hypothetical protein BLA29_012768 [Euroglyphus maynei]|uniref:Uncharacterized protein n=1 Tax=Euroglyphus maynei TaxID=6958 RepID=A0A1Y3BK50_EURMA|nr:hypothetical protein BLA29_012768 [Euroglyphus maynei]
MIISFQIIIYTRSVQLFPTTKRNCEIGIEKEKARINVNESDLNEIKLNYDLPFEGANVEDDSDTEWLSFVGESNNNAASLFLMVDDFDGGDIDAAIDEL